MTRVPGGFVILLGFFPFPKPEQIAGFGGLLGALWFEASS